MTEGSNLVPPEWARQRAIWIGWPRLAEEWGGDLEPARTEIAGVVRALAARLPVRLAVGDDAAEAAARALLGSLAQICRVPTGDIWLRDTGPIMVNSTSGPQAACFEFNGWGGKFDMPGDRETAGAIAEAEALPIKRYSLILEGGALDHDGAGTVLTTRECLLNPNRNGWSETQAEAALETALGVRRVIWLERGLMNDHTDGHIDNIARFIAPGRVACQRPAGPDDPHAERLAEAEDSLRAAGLDVATLPAPEPVFDGAGAAMPASHMNLVFANGEILLPIFDRASGEAAAAGLAEAMPGWRVTTLPSRAILEGGGSFHCMTCNIPEPSETAP